MRKELAVFIQNNYREARSQLSEGRRKNVLRVLKAFWESNPPAPTGTGTGEDMDEDDLAFTSDDDPFDDYEDSAAGIVIRTDFSDNAAWDRFVERFNGIEKEFTNEQTLADEGQDDESDTEEKLLAIAPPDERLSGMSNIALLRLLHEVDIRPAPTPPAGTKRVPKHPLIDWSGWQEIYEGPTLWVYDRRSNTDMTLRLVSQQGDELYGTATGDSWRAQITHIFELQYNMMTGMKINFGGMDRWDYAERKRNVDETRL